MDKYAELVKKGISFQSLIPTPDANGVVQIAINQIHSFKNHPFKVIDDEAMKLLAESIRENGIMTPVIVREESKGCYELISGHRRVFAAKKAGLIKVPAYLKEFSNDEAIIAMVDSNLQRVALPSEKAYAYKMKYDVLKHRGSLRHDVTNSKQSAVYVGEKDGITSRQVYRYMKLTKLDRRLLQKVDEKKISIVLGGRIADLSYEVQDLLVDFIESGGTATESIVTKLLEAQRNGDDIVSVFEEKKAGKKSERRLVLKSNVITRFFDDGTSNEEIRKTIIDLLTEWQEAKRNPGG